MNDETNTKRHLRYVEVSNVESRKAVYNQLSWLHVWSNVKIQINARCILVMKKKITVIILNTINL